VLEPVTLWLVLRAFSAGAVAMSGTEAISNGVPVFKPNESKNAATTLTIMATLLGMFLSASLSFPTICTWSPAIRQLYPRCAVCLRSKCLLLYLSDHNNGILVVAANTAFADFPVCHQFLARDNYMPHSFSSRGDRLAFSTGIMFLGGVSALLLVLFKGNVDSLIHLYAVGVFLAFSMSDTGMVVHWWKTRGKGWKTSILINGADAILTTSILIIVIITKFMYGAWIIILLIPMIVPVFMFIHKHYNRVAEQLRLLSMQASPPQTIEHSVLMPIDDVNYASLRAMSFARTISKDITVIHIATDTKRAEKIQEKMRTYAPDLKPGHRGIAVTRIYASATDICGFPSPSASPGFCHYCHAGIHYRALVGKVPA